MYVATCEIEEALVFVDQSVGHWHLRAICLEGINFEDLGFVSGDVWETWVFNGATFEPSVYSGFSFNSFAVNNGVTYAAREEGIYVLDGTDDAGTEIHDGVILSPSSFGKMNSMRFRQSFFEITGASPVVRGEVNGRTASIPILRDKAMFPRELRGKIWTFLIADFNELGRIELFPIVLTRNQYIKPSSDQFLSSERLSFGDTAILLWEGVLFQIGALTEEGLLSDEIFPIFAKELSSDDVTDFLDEITTAFSFKGGEFDEETDIADDVQEGVFSKDEVAEATDIADDVTVSDLP